MFRPLWLPILLFIAATPLTSVGMEEKKSDSSLNPQQKKVLKDVVLEQKKKEPRHQLPGNLQHIQRETPLNNEKPSYELTDDMARLVPY